jgi:cellulose synthase subunit
MNQATRLFLCSVLLFIFLTPAIPALAQNPDFIDIPLTSLYSNQPIRLNGLISSQNLDFTLPKNWLITEQSWLNIDVSASDLLDLSASSLTISLNGLQLTSLHLRDVVGSVRKIELPPNFFIPGKNVLSLETILYLPNDIKTNCRVWDDPARWLYFNPPSSLHVGFQKQSLPVDLSDFPEAFLQPLDRFSPDHGDQILFVLPDQVKIDDLNAFAATAYFLGYQAGDNFIWQPRILSKSQFDQQTHLNSNIIFIDQIPIQFQNAMATQKNSIGMFPSPWDASKTVMVIFDKDREDGYTPTTIFGDWIRKVLLSGNVAYIDRTADKKPPSFKNRSSFEELGYLDRTVRGIGNENLIYKIYIPYSIDPTSASVSLQITHNPDLDDKTSSIAVVLNGFTVASILPATQGGAATPVRVSLPAKRFRPGINFLRISFDLHVPYTTCERTPSSVWATVFNNSTFELTSQPRNSVPTLRDFPAAFTEYPGATFVVPDQLDLPTLTRVANLTFTIGSSSIYPGQPPRVSTAEKYAAAKSKLGNYILVGLPIENRAIQDVNQFLPQPFKNRSNQLQEGFGVFLPTTNSNASTGLMQITPSPWDNTGTILVLTGTNGQGLSWVWNTILDPKLRQEFSGNVMIIGPENRIAADSHNAQPVSRRFEQSPMVAKIPLIGKFLQANGQSEESISLIAIALAGLFTLLALKVAPIISRFEIRFKRPTENSSIERE